MIYLLALPVHYFLIKFPGASTCRMGGGTHFTASVTYGALGAVSVLLTDDKGDPRHHKGMFWESAGILTVPATTHCLPISTSTCATKQLITMCAHVGNKDGKGSFKGTIVVKNGAAVSYKIRNTFSSRCTLVVSSQLTSSRTSI